MAKKFEMADASLSISRTTSGEGSDYMTIRIKEPGKPPVHLEVSLEDFAYAITGRVVVCRVRSDQGSCVPVTLKVEE